MLSLGEKYILCLGGLAICLDEKRLIKETWFWGPLLSVELEEGFSSAWIRLMY